MRPDGKAGGRLRHRGVCSEVRRFVANLDVCVPTVRLANASSSIGYSYADRLKFVCGFRGASKGRCHAAKSVTACGHGVGDIANGPCRTSAV